MSLRLVYKERLLRKDREARSGGCNPINHGKVWHPTDVQLVEKKFRNGEPVTSIASAMGRAVDSILLVLKRGGMVGETYNSFELPDSTNVPYFKWADKALDEWELNTEARKKVAEWRNREKETAVIAGALSDGLVSQVESDEVSQKEIEMSLNQAELKIENRTYINGVNAAELSDDNLIGKLAELKAKIEYLSSMGDNLLVKQKIKVLEDQKAELEVYMESRVQVTAIEITFDSGVVGTSYK